MRTEAWQENTYSTGSGSVSGISLAEDARPVSPVAHRLGELQQAVASLDKSVDGLFGRLAPALRIDPPDVNKAGNSAPSPVCSPIVSTLNDVINHVQSVNRRVDALAARVEL